MTAISAGKTFLSAVSDAAGSTPGASLISLFLTLALCLLSAAIAVTRVVRADPAAVF